MKAITDTLGVARSNVAERVKGLRQRRGPQTRPGTPVNAKRVYRLMKKHGLLLTRYTGRRRPREHR